jgi:hypothetical protein
MKCNKGNPQSNKHVSWGNKLHGGLSSASGDSIIGIIPFKPKNGGNLYASGTTQCCHRASGPGQKRVRGNCDKTAFTLKLNIGCEQTVTPRLSFLNWKKKEGTYSRNSEMGPRSSTEITGKCVFVSAIGPRHSSPSPAPLLAGIFAVQESSALLVYKRQTGFDVLFLIYGAGAERNGAERNGAERNGAERSGAEPRPLLLRQCIGLLYEHWMLDSDDCGAVSGMNEWQRKPRYSEKTCPSVHHRSHMTWPGVEPWPPRLEPGDSCLSCGTATLTLFHCVHRLDVIKTCYGWNSTLAPWSTVLENPTVTASPSFTEHEGSLPRS